MVEWRYSSIILALALDVIKWLASCPGLLTPSVNPGTQRTRGCMGPRAGLKDMEKRITFVPAGNRIQVAYP
jgi:hypothetical protein